MARIVETADRREIADFSIALRTRPTIALHCMRVFSLLHIAFMLTHLTCFAEPQFASVDQQLLYFAELSEEDLSSYDIAYLNLVCAQDLNGSEDLEIQACLRSLDDMAEFVRLNTESNLHLYSQNPEDYESEDKFRALCMVTFAVKGFGIKYNPERIESPDNLSSDDVFFQDSRDVFLHGLLGQQKRMGTCSSLPVFWTALGRKLDYPVYVSNTLLHFFTQWSTPEGTFNFEGSQNGFLEHDDAHYLEFPIRVTDAQAEYFGLLKPFTRKQEFMHFLITRGACLHANGRIAEARRAYELALISYPSNFSRAALSLFEKANE